jgi:hypothetical protein
MQFGQSSSIPRPPTHPPNPGSVVSWLSMQTNFTKLLPLMTLQQSTLYSVLALLIAILRFLLDETTEELPIIFQLVLNQKSTWILPKKN